MTILRNDVKLTHFENANIHSHFKHVEVLKLKLYRKTDLMHTYLEKFTLPKTNQGVQRTSPSESRFSVHVRSSKNVN